MSGQAKDFVAKSKFDVLVPQATELDFEELFASDEGRNENVSLSSIERRSLLYFGGWPSAVSKAPSSYSLPGARDR